MNPHSVSISEISFTKNGIKDLEILSNGGSDSFANWPVVYIIDDGKNKYAYVGETTNIQRRMIQHLSNPVRKGLTSAHIIHDQTFNKSVILDLEAFLINYMHADGQFQLQNGNGGQHCHNYYDRDSYQMLFRHIWTELKKLGLAKKELSVIENSDLFKYSPFKTLTDDQYAIAESIIGDLALDLDKNQRSVSFICGGAGTGKSILGVFLAKLLADSQNSLTWNTETEEIEEGLLHIASRLRGKRKLKIAYVVPMQGFRSTMKKVFKHVEGLRANMVLSPTEVANSKEYYDVLIVDEAHRLRRRVGLSSYLEFDNKNAKLGLGQDGDELDWILAKSSHQILFYDGSQSIKPADIQPYRFDSIKHSHLTHRYELHSQLRCLGGNDYLDFIDSLLTCNAKAWSVKKNYELALFEDVEDMFNAIRAKEKDYSLCRMIAGFAWEWKTKNMSLAEISKNNAYDIDIEGYHYLWNTTGTDWINSGNSINEIGCIHTTQGFDLNYAGIIIGPELDYDPKNNKLFVIKERYKDMLGKVRAKTGKDLEKFIFNIYKTLLARGIRGTYIYACNPELRKYLSKFVPIKGDEKCP